MDALYSVTVWTFIMALVTYDPQTISFSYGSFMISVPGAELSGCSLLDPGHPNASNHYHSGGSAKCLEVYLDIQRGCRLHAKWCPLS